MAKGATIGARRRRGGAWRLVAVLGLAAVLGYAAWGALRVGGAPEVTLHEQRPAIGAEHLLEARFRAPENGLGTIRIELEQNGRVEVIAEQSFARPGPFALRGGEQTREAVLEAEVGTRARGWLGEGEATIRAVADRLSGPLRRVDPVVVATTLPVRTRPPRLEILSSRHWVRQGGSGLVVMRVGEHVVEAGVAAGETVSPAGPYPSRPADERVALFAVPWDLDDGSSIRAFVVDDAGSRVEQPFVDGYRARALKTDTVNVSDDFLERVVPAIASRTPGFSAEGSLLEQYLRINGEYRRQNLQAIRDLAAASEMAPLWSGGFEQLPRGALQAGFADRRVYRYEGREVDRQTHLGIDLASTARAEVPAANSGRVVWADWLAIYGNVVLIDHGLGLMTGYGHLSQIDVAAGEMVAKGRTVGRTGTTGLAGGDHLHFEVFVHGHSVDPLEWLDPEWVRSNILDRLPGD